MLKGEHIDLYFYPSEADLAPVALAYAEASYDTLALQFGHEVRTRIPLIIYASFTDFEQTNLLPFNPPEGLLGFTEFLKRRVALPFRGNLAEFRHTLRHELVHVFQLSLLGDSYYHTARGGRPNLPLWWTEGLAELWSAGEDARDEMILRDLTLSGNLPPMQELGLYTGGLVYPLGGRFHRWLADTYGDWRAALMYKELTRYATFEDAIFAIYGRSLAQLNEEFQLAMRRDYYPTAETHAPLSVAAMQIARGAVKPAFLPDTGMGDVVYLSAADGYVTVYRRPIDGHGGARAVLTAGRSPELESFHAFESRLDASRPGFLLLSSKYGDRDALLVWDLRQDEVAGRYQFPELVSILSPTWMPDGQSIVFSGLSESGISDLYRLRLPEGTLEPLTDDVYQDVGPSPSPDGTRIVFASDRTHGGIKGAVNLFVLDLASGAIRQLTSGPWVDETPQWAEPNRIYFTSGRDGVLNVFSTDTLGRGRRETSAWTGAFDAEPLPGGDALLVGGFQNLSWGVYRYPVDSAARGEHFTLADSVPPHSQWVWNGAADAIPDSAEGRPYQRRLTLDFAAGEAVVVPGFGGAQGAAFLLSDLLGDHLLFGSLASFQGRDLGSFFENINATAIYVNRTQRVNWGIGAFRLKGRNVSRGVNYQYDETATGALGLIRYPLSRYSRLEGTIIVEHSDRIDLNGIVSDARRTGWIASNYLSFVRDNSLWIPSGPIDGSRFSLTTGVSSDFTNGRFDSFVLSGDWRRYLRLGTRSAYAVRAFGFYTSGERPPLVNIGGTLGLRGYPYFGYIVGSRAYMLNQELRVPLLRHLTFGTPFGDVRFPPIQGAVFLDVGRAWFPDGPERAVLGSYGVSFRLPVLPLVVFRLDVGRRFASDDFQGYDLSASQTTRSFVSFFFGYNY